MTEVETAYAVWRAVSAEINAGTADIPREDIERERAAFQALANTHPTTVQDALIQLQAVMVEADSAMLDIRESTYDLFASAYYSIAEMTGAEIMPLPGDNSKGAYGELNVTLREIEPAQVNLNYVEPQNVLAPEVRGGAKPNGTYVRSDLEDTSELRKQLVEAWRPKGVNAMRAWMEEHDVATLVPLPRAVLQAKLDELTN